jgi:hypothetical protein
MLSQRLGRALDMSVYPYSPATLQDFLEDERFIDDPPDIVLLGCTERNIVLFEDMPPDAGQMKPRGPLDRFLSAHLGLAELMDRLYKGAMKQYVRGRIEQAKKSIVRRVERRDKKTRKGRPTGLITKMLFYQRFSANEEVSRLNHAIDYPPDEVARLVPVIQSYDRLLGMKGMRFIFLPIPNKETIFYDFFPVKKKPLFLTRLISALKRADIEVIDTMTAFEKAYREEGLLLYHTDDTHWNTGGINLTAALILRHLNAQAAGEAVTSRP